MIIGDQAGMGNFVVMKDVGATGRRPDRQRYSRFEGGGLFNHTTFG